MVEGSRVGRPALHLDRGHRLDQGQVDEGQDGPGHVAESDDPEADDLGHGRVLAHAGPDLGQLGVDLGDGLPAHRLGNVQAEVEGEDGVAFFGAEVLARHGPFDATGGPGQRQHGAPGALEADPGADDHRQHEHRHARRGHVEHQDPGQPAQTVRPPTWRARPPGRGAVRSTPQDHDPGNHLAG